MRHSYVPDVDGPELDRLLQHFNRVFEKVDRWKGYEKPKLHPRDHLRISLEEFGPFRAFWCMPWEAFLQLLKKMFRMGNWNSAPYSVGKMWVSKSITNYRNPTRCSWYDDAVQPTSEFHTDIDALIPNAPAVRAVMSLRRERPYAVRFLRVVTRGADEVRNGCWLLVEQRGQQPLVGHVDQMIEVTYAQASASVIRMWCSSAKQVTIDSDGTVWAPCGASAACMLVQLEAAQVTVVRRIETGQRIVFTP